MIGEFKKEFQDFWTQTADKVRAYMYCACENWADADDMAQECYLRALRAWDQFDGRASRQAWLWGIAKRTRVDWFRRKKRDSLTVTSKNLDEFSKAASEKINVDQTQRIWNAIKCLKAEHGEIIHLRFAAGLSYEQISQALGIPVGTVRSRLHRGLKDVRKQIGEWENET